MAVGNFEPNPSLRKSPCQSLVYCSRSTGPGDERLNVALQITNTVSSRSKFREKSKKLFAIKFFN